MKVAGIHICSFLMIVLSACDTEESDPALFVYVASSTAPAMKEIVGLYEQKTGVQVILNVGSTSTLVRQIEHGASCDILLAANTQWMERLSKRSAVLKTT